MYKHAKLILVEINKEEKPNQFYDIPQPTVSIWANDMIDKMNSINNLRLYWVWGNALIDVLFTLGEEFELIDPDSFNQLENKLKWPAPITGNLSWSLYYLRFLLRVYICIDPILPGRSEEQKGLSVTERLFDTLDDNKFGLLNDIFWGTVNLACFAWLTYRKNASVGYAGDLLTAGFLIMDWILTLLDYIETQKKYYQNCENLEADINHLKKLLLQTNDKAEKAAIKLRLANAEQRLSDYQFDYKYTKMELINNMVYATLLMLCFPLLIGMISAPASLPLSAGIILAGAILCFAVTVIFQAINNLIPVMKASAQRSRLLKHQQNLIELLKQTHDLSQQKILAVQIDDLQSMIDYQSKQMKFHTICVFTWSDCRYFIPSTGICSLIYFANWWCYWCDSCRVYFSNWQQKINQSL